MIFILPIILLFVSQIVSGIVIPQEKCGCDLEKLRKERQEKYEGIMSKDEPNHPVQLEDDMIAEPERVRQLYNPMLKYFRSALPDTMRWPNKIVPYYIDPSFKPAQVNMIKSTIAGMQVKLNNCIRFINYQSKPNLTNYVHVVNNISTCTSTLGRITKPKPQLVIFGAENCFAIGKIEHEMMHTLGFTHEHNRPDRDSFVTVNELNIKTEECKNFIVCDNCRTFNFPYDYSSVMHYSEDAFACGNKTTIKSKDKKKPIAYQRKGMTANDIKKVLYYYECPNQ